MDFKITISSTSMKSCSIKCYFYRIFTALYWISYLSLIPVAGPNLKRQTLILARLLPLVFSVKGPIVWRKAVLYHLFHITSQYSAQIVGQFLKIKILQCIFVCNLQHYFIMFQIKLHVLWWKAKPLFYEINLLECHIKF